MERKCCVAPVCAVIRMHTNVKTSTSQTTLRWYVGRSLILIPIDVMPFGSGMVPCALGMCILSLIRGASILQATS